MLSLLTWLALCYTVAWFGAQFPPGDWYDQLPKPPWTPPDYLFPPVWMILYGMMGIAAWLVWRSSGLTGAVGALILFIIQLMLNAIWSWIFFGLHMPGLAFVEIAVLWLTILVTTIAFWQHSPLAGWLLIPYLLWVGFASLLNFSIWQRLAADT